MSGPTEFHGRTLVETMEYIDDFIATSLSEGAVPVIDAVEMSRLLHALVQGKSRHRLNANLLQKRFDRMFATARNPVAKIKAMAPPFQWSPRGEADGDDT